METRTKDLQHFLGASKTVKCSKGTLFEVGIQKYFDKFHPKHINYCFI